MDDREKFENAFLSVRFRGRRLAQNGVSVYDLSTTLLSMQRILHKAYLSIDGRLVKGAFPNKKEREQLALQLGERQRQSDAYALIPILTDPQTQEHLKLILKLVIDGLVGYYTKDLIDKLRKEKSEEKKVFIGSIHAEVVNIAERIDAAGGVEGISIGAPSSGRETIAAFNEETKDYLSALRAQKILGSFQTIRGRVYKFYPASNIVAIRRQVGKRSTNNVSVFLKSEQFERIRYHRESTPTYEFEGWPIYPFGVESQIISEFEADSIKYIPDADS